MKLTAKALVLIIATIALFLVVIMIIGGFKSALFQ